MGQGQNERRAVCPPCPSQLLAQTSVSDREPQAGEGKLQDWQGSPATPSPNRMPEGVSGIVKKLGHSIGPASVQSCLLSLLGMV